MQSTLNHNCGLQSVVSMSQQRPEGKPAGEDLFTGTCKPDRITGVRTGTRVPGTRCQVPVVEG